MVKRKKIYANIAKSLTIILIISIFFCAVSAFAASDADQNNHRKIAENSMYTLYFNDKAESFYIRSNKSGKIFSSNIDPNYYSIDFLSPLWQNNINALFTFSYLNFEGERKSANNLTEKHTLKVSDIKSGVKLQYEFTKLKISLSVQLRLTEQGISLMFPDDGIIENLDGIGYGLESIEPLPFFGAASDEAGGYIFIPDGSGSLMRFENFQDPYRNMPYTWPIYSENHLIWKENKTVDEGLLMPCFGIKKTDTAMFAIISNGQFDANVTVAPSLFIAGLNRVYASFVIRKSYEVALPDKAAKIRFDKERIHTDREILFVPLEDEKSNYSGMAEAYRNYLKRNGILKEPVKKPSTEISLFGMCNEPRMFFSHKVVMTSFNDAKEITNQLMEQGADSLRISMIGFGDKGAEGRNTGGKPAVKLGGGRAWNDFAEYAHLKDISVSFYEDYNTADTSNASFSKRKDVIIKQSGLPMVNSTENLYVYNPLITLKRFTDRIFKKYVPLKAGGIVFEKFGENIYDSFGKGKELTRFSYSGIAGKMMNETKEALGFAAMTKGNDYLLQFSDAIYSLDYQDSGRFIIDENVPFYQMVVHGYKGYTSCDFGNLSHDFDFLRLKWVEYGYIPSFLLTWESPSLLKKTAYNTLFSTEFSNWRDTVVKTSHEFNKIFSLVGKAEMTEHQRLTDELIKVNYSNGKCVYINYSDKEIEIDNDTVKAMDYLIK